MAILFIILLLAALVGVARPYLGWGRGPFVLLAIVASILIGLTLPKTDNKAAASTPADAADESDSAEVADADPTLDVTKQYSWIEVSKDAIRAKLKDPNSATFRDVRFYSGGGGPVTCGQVNAKNSFGGYNGFERFVAAGDTLAYMESEISDDFTPVWNKFCVAKSTDEAHTD